MIFIIILLKLLNLLGSTSTIHEQQQSQIHDTSSTNDGSLLAIEGEEGVTTTTDSSGLFAGLTITSSSPSPKTRPQSSSKTRNQHVPARKQQVEPQGHDLIDVMMMSIRIIDMFSIAFSSLSRLH